jgi:hypothetical protein
VSENDGVLHRFYAGLCKENLTRQKEVFLTQRNVADVWDTVVNVFRVLRDPEKSEQPEAEEVPA